MTQPTFDPRAPLLAALNACAALYFGASCNGSAQSFATAYAQAFRAARREQPSLSEETFRESFFRSVARLFGGEATASEQTVATQAVLGGRRALAICYVAD